MNTIDGASGTGSFQNPPSTTDPTRNYRLDASEALQHYYIQDCTNHQETRSRKARLMADTAIRRQSARGAPRGQASEGYRARVRSSLSDNSDSTTLCGLSKNNENISAKVHRCIYALSTQLFLPKRRMVGVIRDSTNDVLFPPEEPDST